MGDSWRWWVVALLPRPVARWLWHAEWVPLGAWTPYVLGQSLGRRGHRQTRGGPVTYEDRARELVTRWSAEDQRPYRSADRPGMHRDLLAFARSVERETVERCARDVSAMVVGGRQWTHDQAVAAEALLAAAAHLRALPDDTEET